MTKNWMSFKIDLCSLNNFLKQNVPSADGIVACLDNYEIVETSPLTPTDISLIEEYFSSLTKEGEDAKLARPKQLEQAKLAVKESVLATSFDNLTVLQKKIILGFTLTAEEEAGLLGE